MGSISKFLLAASVLVLAACDSDNDSPPPVPGTTVQILHASPDAPAVNVFVDGAEALSGVDFKQSSGWLDVDAGTYSVDVQGILPGDDVSVIGPADLTFDADTINTVVALNDVANIEPVILTQPDTPVSAGSARVWVLHGARNVQDLVGGPVDVYVTAPGADWARSTSRRRSRPTARPSCRPVITRSASVSARPAMPTSCWPSIRAR
jgi:hypothetical protein